MGLYAIPAGWALTALGYLWAGTRPDGYAVSVLHEAPAYPLGGVLGCLAVSTGEALALHAILRPRSYRRSWRRAAFALAGFAPLLVISFVALMHAPGYVLMHFVLVLLVNVALAILLAVSLVEAARHRG